MHLVADDLDVRPFGVEHLARLGAVPGGLEQQREILAPVAGEYTYYANGIGGPTAFKQPDRAFAIVEGVPNDPYAPAQEFEKAFRVKTGVSLFYPRAVNEYRTRQGHRAPAHSLAADAGATQAGLSRRQAARCERLAVAET
jgi:hypothetical protein